MLDLLHLAFLANAWTAFSPLALAAGGSGLGLLVLAFVGLSWLPGFLKRPLIFAGIVLLAGAAIYQAGQARGAHDAFARDAARSLLAEKLRTLKAKAVARDDAAKAKKDLEAAQADARKLKDLNDALSKVKARDRLCVDRDVSRRLRQL